MTAPARKLDEAEPAVTVIRIPTPSAGPELAAIVARILARHRAQGRG